VQIRSPQPAWGAHLGVVLLKYLIDLCTLWVYNLHFSVGIGPTLWDGARDVTRSRNDRFKSVNDECL
jgi:hypothetical protein